jgi:hypothetical protein
MIYYNEKIIKSKLAETTRPQERGRMDFSRFD